MDSVTVSSVSSNNSNPYSRPPINFERLKSERVRLDTFKSNPPWPISFIRPEDCASTGFFFLQDGDKVQCAFCRGVAGEWEPGDVPAVEHRRHFPRCPFVCSLPVGNLPISLENSIQIDEEHESDPDTEEEDEEDDDAPVPSVGFDVCGPFEPFQLHRASDHTMPQIRGARPLSGNMAEVANDLAIKTCSGPSHLNFVTGQSRTKTFVNWPAAQKIEDMSDAGFFYIGTRDYVKCFYCDGGLRNWEENDEPWIEHARWFPNCTYVQLNKGDEFIKTVRQKKPALTKEYQKNQVSGSCLPESRFLTEEERLIDTPIVKAALDMGMEVNKVKAALRRKLSTTGEPFLTTESLLEAIIRDSDHDSGLGSQRGSTSESSQSSGSDEDEDLNHSRPASDATLVAEGCSGSGSGGGGAESICMDERRDDDGISMSSSPQCGTSKEMKGENLEEEIRRLREARQCKICMDNEVGVVFLPCGHLVSCVKCATAFSNCALCRQPIKAVVRTYLS